MDHQVNLEALKKYTIPELIHFHRILGEKINEMIKEQARDEMGSFSFGEAVYFIADCGHRIEGKIERFNQKTISILATDGKQWRVSPTLINKIVKN